MSYAVIKTGGKQYRVQEGDKIDVEKLAVDVDDDIRFVEVLLVNDGSATKVGAPFVDGATVTAKVVDQFRGKKGVAFKFKRRKGYRLKQGHRQRHLQVRIEKIEA